MDKICHTQFKFDIVLNQHQILMEGKSNPSKLTYLAKNDLLSLVSPRSLATFSCSIFWIYIATSGLQ